MTTDADIHLEGVTKRFGETTAVDDLTLSIPRGAFYALLGPSGCGKTTTLRMVGGFEDPTAGTVWINEHLAIGSEMPHGGVKGSGFGKDMSMYALEEYTAIKHVVFELTGAPRKDWYDAVSTPEAP